MSIISEALKKASDKKNDRVKLRRDDFSPIFVDEKKIIREKRARWSLLSSVGTLLIVAFAIIAFLSNTEYLQSLAYRAPAMPAPKLMMPASEAPAVPRRGAVPILSPAEELPLFTLNGIIYGAGENMAMINNSIVKKDDLLQGAKIVDIGRDKVIVSYRNKEFTLKIK